MLVGYVGYFVCNTQGGSSYLVPCLFTSFASIISTIFLISLEMFGFYLFVSFFWQCGTALVSSKLELKYFQVFSYNLDFFCFCKILSMLIYY